ncbi:MAG: arsenate reductase ArsC [Chloroflexota bacterium]|nr:arsenate reductase ArsC [Chloroflexota bacterium]
MKKPKVLFLCTGNSARSQIAEGLINHFLGDRWEASSAGTKPAGYVHPLAVQVMAELGINISAQRSKPVSEFRDAEFDLVVTVCDDAARNCPVWLGKGKRVHLGFPDPAAATGSEEERLELFRQVRDGLRQQVFACLEQAEASESEQGSEKDLYFGL